MNLRQELIEADFVLDFRADSAGLVVEGGFDVLSELLVCTGVDKRDVMVTDKGPSVVAGLGLHPLRVVLHGGDDPRVGARRALDDGDQAELIRVWPDLLLLCKEYELGVEKKTKEKAHRASRGQGRYSRAQPK